MNILNINELTEEKYQMKIENYQDTVKVSCTGVVDTQLPNEKLVPFFLELDGAVSGQKLKYIYLDLLNLEFINSRGIGCFLKWIVHIESKPLHEQYKIHFILNKDENWQKIAFKEFLKLHMSLLYFDFQ